MNISSKKLINVKNARKKRTAESYKGFNSVSIPAENLSSQRTSQEVPACPVSTVYFRTPSNQTQFPINRRSLISASNIDSWSTRPGSPLTIQLIWRNSPDSGTHTHTHTHPELDDSTPTGEQIMETHPKFMFGATAFAVVVGKPFQFPIVLPHTLNLFHVIYFVPQLRLPVPPIAPVPLRMCDLNNKICGHKKDSSSLKFIFARAIQNKAIAFPLNSNWLCSQRMLIFHFMYMALNDMTRRW